MFWRIGRFFRQSTMPYPFCDRPTKSPRLPHTRDSRLHKCHAVQYAGESELCPSPKLSKSGSSVYICRRKSGEKGDLTRFPVDIRALNVFSKFILPFSSTLVRLHSAVWSKLVLGRPRWLYPSLPSDHFTCFFGSLSSPTPNPTDEHCSDHV